MSILNDNLCTLRCIVLGQFTRGVYRQLEHSERWIRLKPEAKVSVAINMVDLVVAVCAENEKQKKQDITDKEMIIRLRKRFQKPLRISG